MTRVRLLVVLLALSACLLGALPALAGAEVQTIDFDSAPPALGSPLDGVGDVSFPLSEGFRPYRSDVGARAHSGTVVGDLGRCAQEVEAGGGEAGSCEFFQAHTTGVLARTAKSVTLFAGRFAPPEPGEEPEEAVLTAFAADGTPLDTTGLVPIDGAGFDAPLSVSSTAGEIASFTIEAFIGPNGESSGPELGIDDLSVSFADGGEPDFSVSATSQILRLVQGQSVQVPVQLSRLNGSNGTVRLSVSGLPTGVSATPVDVNGAATSATISIEVASNAAPTGFTPFDATLVADPLGAPNVGPGPRQVTLSARVIADFELSANGFSAANPPPDGNVVVEVPDCAAVDVPVKIDRDIAMDRDVSLSLRSGEKGAAGLPAGISAEILPSAVVPPGGNLVAERTIRLRADWGVLGPGAMLVTLLGTTASGGSAAESTHSLPLKLVHAKPSATIATGSSLAFTPRFGKEATRVRIHGSGFCPGTMVEVGNPDSELSPTLAGDHTIEFTLPRYAISGPIRIIPPGGFPVYKTEDSLTVDSVRNTDGFQFENPGFGSLSLHEFVEAFGADDVFFSVNPCWPFGDCRVQTDYLDPIAAIEWGVIGRLSEAHCFGMLLASQELQSGRVPYGRFVSAGSPSVPSHVYDIPSATGPNGYTESFLDAEQVKQYSSEYQQALLRRSDSLDAQLKTLERAFSHNREPMITISHEAEYDKDKDGAHALLAYDLVQTPKTAEIFTYDPNRPFDPAEDFGGRHRGEVDLSAVRIDKVSKTWEYVIENGAFSAGKVWKGGDDGSLWVPPEGAVPANPSLPGVGTLATLIYTSVDAVRTRSSSHAEFVPPSESLPSSRNRTPAGSGTWVSGDPGRPMEVTFEGVKDGHYTEAYTAPGFVASVEGVPTSKGVRDSIKGDSGSLTFRSGKARPLQIELARRSGPTLTTAATLETHASADGTDTAGLADGGLSYAHDGAAATLEFTLTTVRRNGGPATFVSGPIPIARGDHLTAEPVGRDLHRVRLRIRDSRGHITTRTLRNHGHGHAHLKLGAPKVSHRKLTIPVKLAGMGGRAVIGTTLRLMKGHRLIARKALALKGANGTRRIVWRLPRKVRHGSYRLLTDARAITTGARGSTAAGGIGAHRAVRVRIGRL